MRNLPLYVGRTPALEEDTYLPYFFDFVAYPTITREALKAHIDGKGVCIYRKVGSPARR